MTIAGAADRPIWRQMPNLADMPDVLPLFPLAGCLLLPRARLPLHVFEPRYLAMIDDCLKTPYRLIGMIQPVDEGQEGLRQRLRPVGCAGRLTGFSETEDGRYMITLSGTARFRLSGVVDGFTPYLRGAADWSEFSGDLGGSEADPGFDREAFFFLLGRYFARHRLATDLDSLGQTDDETLVNLMAMLAPLEPGDKQALLEAPHLGDRREALMTLMEFSLHSAGNGEETRQ